MLLLLIATGIHLVLSIENGYMWYTTGILINHTQICNVQFTYNSYLPYNYGALVFLFIDTHEISYFLSVL